MKNKIGLIFYLLAVITFFASCDEDIFSPNLAQDLEGDWQVVAFLEEGVITTYYGDTYKGMIEQIPNIFTAFTLEFSKYKNDSADFEWVHTHANGTTERLEGDITANSAEDELDFDFDANSSGYSDVEFIFYVNDDELVLTGDLKGKPVIIRAERD